MKDMEKSGQQGEKTTVESEEMNGSAEAGMKLSENELSQAAGGWGREVSPIFGDITTCELCGNDKPGTVYPLTDPYSGLRIIEYYCERCQQSFGVYVG